VACYAALPGVLAQWAEAARTDVHAQEVYWVYLPSVLGSVGFVFASYVYLVEVTRTLTLTLTRTLTRTRTRTRTQTPEPEPEPEP